MAESCSAIAVWHRRHSFQRMKHSRIPSVKNLGLAIRPPIDIEGRARAGGQLVSGCQERITDDAAFARSRPHQGEAAVTMCIVVTAGRAQHDLEIVVRGIVVYTERDRAPKQNCANRGALREGIDKRDCRFMERHPETGRTAPARRSPSGEQDRGTIFGPIGIGHEGLPEVLTRVHAARMLRKLAFSQASDRNPASRRVGSQSRCVRPPSTRCSRFGQATRARWRSCSMIRMRRRAGSG